MDKRPAKVADLVSNHLGIRSKSPYKGAEQDLQGVDSNHTEWCKNVLQEYELLPDNISKDWTDYKKRVPLIYEQLLNDAEAEDMPVEEYLDLYEEGIGGYIFDLVRYCKEQVKKAECYPTIFALSELVRAERAIPVAEVREPLSRYQTTLDNQLYKTLKSLREAQQWRLSSIDAVPRVAETEMVS